MFAMRTRYTSPPYATNTVILVEGQDERPAIPCHLTHFLLNLSNYQLFQISTRYLLSVILMSFFNFNGPKSTYIYDCSGVDSNLM
jgi:hypothetical protein